MKYNFRSVFFIVILITILSNLQANPKVDRQLAVAELELKVLVQQKQGIDEELTIISADLLKYAQAADKADSREQATLAVYQAAVDVRENYLLKLMRKGEPVAEAALALKEARTRLEGFTTACEQRKKESSKHQDDISDILKDARKREAYVEKRIKKLEDYLADKQAEKVASR